MHLRPFLLDRWLDRYEHDIQFNLGGSEGPAWTVNEILNLATGEQRERFLSHKVVYSRPAGAERLRAAIAAMQGVDTESVQIVTGASEALLVLMWLAAEPAANVILPQPGYPPFSALPESLGMEIRYYALHKENGFCIDVEEIKKLADGNTKLVLVNSPHTPTGTTITDADFESLHDFTSARGIQLVSDEVYHPIYHGPPKQSAARLPHVTVIHDFSKVFPFSGVRTGWMIDHDQKNRERYWNARTHFSISNNTTGEILAEIAMCNRDMVLEKTQKTASRNLVLLDNFLAEHREMLGWVRPQGGTTAFPWLLSGEDARCFCQAATEQGILLVPGYCYDMPSHFRLGFAGVAPDGFSKALDRLGELLKNWSTRMAPA